MGIYDREYYRDEHLGGQSYGSGLPMVTSLVIISGVLYLLDIFTRDHWLMRTMAASPNSLVKPWLWWQLLTYGFAHSYQDQWHIIANMFGLWMFGRDVEGVYGRGEILRIYLLTIVLGGVVWSARAGLTVDPALWDRYIMLGASGAVTCVILLFCFLFPRRTVLLMFIIPAPAWVLGLLIVVMNVLGARMPGEGNVAYDVHLVGAAFAFGYFRFGWNLGRWTSRLPSPSRWFKPRPRLRVHDPGSSQAVLDEEADRILDKVNRDGIESLTSRERKALEDYSRRMRQKHR